MKPNLKSPSLEGLAHDNGPLTDERIRRRILEGYYGAERLRHELINGSSGTYGAALEGRYGTLALKLAREVRDNGLRRTIVRGPKVRNKSVDDILAEMDEELLEFVREMQREE